MFNNIEGKSQRVGLWTLVSKEYLFFGCNCNCNIVEVLNYPL